MDIYHYKHKSCLLIHHKSYLLINTLKVYFSYIPKF